MATRYKDRITILEDAEIEELYGRPRFTHDERVHYFALTPEERAVATTAWQVGWCSSCRRRGSHSAITLHRGKQCPFGSIYRCRQ